ncbi:hypothetical protein CSC70_04405 [Pseudoxanthomonas kalamensis DSM 18571]|uniref:DUF3734 domain-containing protein n=1 Tax=Pseudoxanthomonas kalamensis TaxID=289483 RepID=UPI00139136B6|nr:patatin-like phospholipase family protein [Pseudoxanthomonas kalamensis]KAF1711168.1 hypothetical protein CSC70_04405 [Pseudoxanthomonas kalamensis DSM 18571]
MATRRSRPGTTGRKSAANSARGAKEDSQPAATALVLQGGGALGAYQAGVYEGLHAAGIEPDWLAGISIGAFNTAIIAGNPPGKRIEALREFWRTISRPYWLPATTLGQEAWLEYMDADSRGWLDAWEAWRAMIEGQHGFYTPRPWFDPSATGPGTASIYDTRPMLDTLERLVDFDRLNDGGIRVSVGAVDVASGNMEYFDNAQIRLDARHIMASGALPPAFPAVEIDGRWFWDGGIVSNTPLSQVFASEPRRDALVFQVDLWNARGELPKHLLDVAEREKEIRFSSRTRTITNLQRLDQHYRRMLRELLEKIPAGQRADNPWCQRAEALACPRRYSVIHLIYRERARFGHFKDYQFGRTSMREHWRAGLTDIRRALEHPEWLQLPEGEDTFVTHDATAD